GRRWYKYYTKFFGTDGEFAIPIVNEALDKWRNWNDQIGEWQRQVVESNRPLWLKSGLFNELYFLVDSSSSWVVEDVDEKAEVKGLGHFGYLECFEYPYMNTYDVLYYSSFATLMNWPELDNSIQQDFANSINVEDNQEHTLLVDKKVVPRKRRGSVPHDLGMPQEDPWHKLNAYAYLDCGKWKDLNPKFVLQVYRNYIYTKDEQFLRFCWPAVKLAMDYVDAFDKDDDGIPENEGFPDQTYDNWRMEGPSAYCGSLYLGASQAMIAMAQKMRDEGVEKKYRSILKNGQRTFEDKLWNGRYYNFDSSNARHHDSIMADQLAGQWYMHVCDLPSIIPAKNEISALRTIYNFNVLRFQLGQIGAVNGMRPDGTPDDTCAQSSEVWTGTCYALAAFMIHAGLVDEGLKTAQGVYDTTYKDRGYWFRTPEAWTEEGNFRASMYMRPLSIWAIEYALRRQE
ncbi:MAG: glycoside hydrolase family 116 protein, partial [Candidatus Thorarchaeota archaeon]